MVGILVHGDNHFIVHGPMPDENEALALVRYWSIILIGAETPPSLRHWRIVSRELRENLRWAVLVRDATQMSPAVSVLLGELTARGVGIHTFPNEASLKTASQP